jgi:hypothetical protein
MVAKNLQPLKGFRVGHLNIASLVKHVDELKIYLEKEPLDVLSINETRLDETISTDSLLLVYPVTTWLPKIVIGKGAVLQFTITVF